MKRTHPSTGKLPPTPKPITAKHDANAVKLVVAPVAIPKIPPMMRVKFLRER